MLVFFTMELHGVYGQASCCGAQGGSEGDSTFILHVCELEKDYAMTSTGIFGAAASFDVVKGGGYGEGTLYH